MLSVFYAIIPDGKIEKTGNILRDEEICSALNEKVKRQKFFAWKLLQKGLNKLGFNPLDIEFFKSGNGKWTSNKVNFSISHSEKAVVVAISDLPVGVDVEKQKNVPETLALKILTNDELKEFNLLNCEEKSDYLIKKWTEKESIFKSLDEKVCKHKLLCAKDNAVTSKIFEIDNQTYFLSVCHHPDFTPEFFFIENFN